MSFSLSSHFKHNFFLQIYLHFLHLQFYFYFYLFFNFLDTSIPGFNSFAGATELEPSWAEVCLYFTGCMCFYIYNSYIKCKYIICCSLV